MIQFCFSALVIFILHLLPEIFHTQHISPVYILLYIIHNLLLPFAISVPFYWSSKQILQSVRLPVAMI